MKIEVIKTPQTAEEKRLFAISVKEAGCYFCKSKEVNVSISLDGSVFCWCTECKGEYRVREEK